MNRPDLLLDILKKHFRLGCRHGESVEKIPSARRPLRILPTFSIDWQNTERLSS